MRSSAFIDFLTVAWGCYLVRLAAFQKAIFYICPYTYTKNLLQGNLLRAINCCKVKSVVKCKLLQENKKSNNLKSVAGLL